MYIYAHSSTYVKSHYKRTQAKTGWIKQRYHVREYTKVGGQRQGERGREREAGRERQGERTQNKDTVKCGFVRS